MPTLLLPDPDKALLWAIAAGVTAFASTYIAMTIIYPGLQALADDLPSKETKLELPPPPWEFKPIG